MAAAKASPPHPTEVSVTPPTPYVEPNYAVGVSTTMWSAQKRNNDKPARSVGSG